MAKDREIVCEYYINEGNCKKGHKGIFNKTCQTCKDYSILKGAFPRRKNLKKEKTTEWMKNFKNFI